MYLLFSKPWTHLPCCCYSRLNCRHQTFIKQLLCLAFYSFVLGTVSALNGKLTYLNLMKRTAHSCGNWGEGYSLQNNLKRCCKLLWCNWCFYLNSSLGAICRIWYCCLHIGAADLCISDICFCLAYALSDYLLVTVIFPFWSLLYTLNCATGFAVKPIPDSASAAFLCWKFWVVVVRQKHKGFTNKGTSWSKACPLMMTRHPWATPLFFSITSICTASSICTFCV